jgi:hypothetical protein
MVETLVDKGFNDLLKYNLPSASKTEIAAHIHLTCPLPAIPK